MSCMKTALLNTMLYLNFLAVTQKFWSLSSEIVWHLHMSFCLLLGFCLLSHLLLAVLLVTLYFFFIPSLMTWNPVSATLQTLLRNTDQIILL